MTTLLKKLSLFKLSTLKFFFALYLLILAYAFLFTLILQNYLPALHAGHGLLIGDNILFHNLAVDMANNIARSGWSEWKVFALNTAATINVGIVSIVYYFLGPNPVYLLPLNALLQTLAAYLIFRIVYLISSNVKAGYLSALLFSLMPTTLIWTSQLHKDGYSAVAWFLTLLVALSPDSKMSQKQKIALHSLAMGILYVTRPLYLNLIFLVLLLDFLYILVFKQIQISRILHSLNLVITAMFIFSFYYFKPVVNAHSDTFDATNQGLKLTQSYALSKNKTSDNMIFNWNDGRGPFDKLFLQVASMRVNMIYFSGPESNSLVDGSLFFQSKKDFYRYFPRAFVIALLLPDPLFLINIGNKQAYGLIIEMLIYYFLLINLIYFLIRQKLNHDFNRIIFFSLTASIFFAYMCPILGSLHRGRYPFFCLLMSLGVISTFVHWHKIKNCLTSSR